MVIVLLFFGRYNSFECKYKEYFYNMMLVMVLVGSFNVPIVVRMCGLLCNRYVWSIVLCTQAV